MNLPRMSLDELKPTVADAAAEFGIPEDSIWRKMRAENSGSVSGAEKLKDVATDAVSPKGARGIMQVTQPALDDVIQAGLVPAGTKLTDLSPKDQVRIGAAYISRLRSYSTDPAVEDAMYNFGPKARFQMDRLPAETQDYIKKSGATRMADSESTQATPQPTAFGGGMMDSSGLLRALLGNNKAQNENIQSGANEVSALETASNQKKAQAVTDQTVAVTAAASIAAQKADIAYQNNSLGEQLQTMFNMNPSDANNEISDSLAIAQAAKEARVSARADYDEAASVGFLDNPVQFLLNQVRLPQLAAKNNALADQEDLALNNIVNKTAMLKAAQSTLVANTADQVKQVSLDQANNDAKVANAKLADEEGKNLAMAAAQKLQIVGLVDKMGDNTRSTIGTVIALQDREEQASLRNAVKKDANDRKAMDAADEARLNGRLKLVSDSLGMAEPMTVKRLKTFQNKKDQDAWLNASLTGQMGEDLQGSLSFYLGNGSRPSIAASGGASTYLTAKKLEDAGAGMQSMAERSMMAANPTGKKPTVAESRTAGFKLYTDSVVSSMSSPTERIDLSSSQWDKQYNPYVAPFKAFNGAVAVRPELVGLKNNVMFKAIDGLVTTDAVRTDNLTAEQQQQVIGSVAAQVEAKTITPAKAAADISVYMSAATAWSRQMNGYTLFSLPVQDSYLYTMDGETDRRKVDLMNPATLENALMKRAMEARKQNAAFRGGIFGVN